MERWTIRLQYDAYGGQPYASIVGGPEHWGPERHGDLIELVPVSACDRYREALEEIVSQWTQGGTEHFAAEVALGALNSASSTSPREQR